jgi:hypothetical protein
MAKRYGVLMRQTSNVRIKFQHYVPMNIWVVNPIIVFAHTERYRDVCLFGIGRWHHTRRIFRDRVLILLSVPYLIGTSWFLYRSTTYRMATDWNVVTMRDRMRCSNLAMTTDMVELSEVLSWVVMNNVALRSRLLVALLFTFISVFNCPIYQMAHHDNLMATREDHSD